VWMSRKSVVVWRSYAVLGRGVGEKLEVGKDTDILRLLDKRSKHRQSHSELLSVAEGARNLRNYGSKVHKTDWNGISLTSLGPLFVRCQNNTS
jgi:hypothetical protein